MAVSQIDLGKVIGPPGQDGAPGASGHPVLLLDHVPTSADGADGDVAIVVSGDYVGTIWGRAGDIWGQKAAFATEGATVDEEIDGESANPVRNSAIAAALAAEAETRASDIAAKGTLSSATLGRTDQVIASSGTLQAYRNAYCASVYINTDDTWPFGTGNTPYIIPSGYRPLLLVECGATVKVNDKIGTCRMRLESSGSVYVAGPVRTYDGSIISTGSCTQIILAVSYLPEAQS